MKQKRKNPPKNSHHPDQYQTEKAEPSAGPGVSIAMFKNDSTPDYCRGFDRDPDRIFLFFSRHQIPKRTGIVSPETSRIQEMETRLAALTNACCLDLKMDTQLLQSRTRQHVQTWIWCGPGTDPQTGRRFRVRRSG